MCRKIRTRIGSDSKRRSRFTNRVLLSNEFVLPIPEALDLSHHLETIHRLVPALLDDLPYSESSYAILYPLTIFEIAVSLIMSWEGRVPNMHACYCMQRASSVTKSSTNSLSEEIWLVSTRSFASTDLCLHIVLPVGLFAKSWHSCCAVNCLGQEQL
jgi:hypothetical protein